MGRQLLKVAVIASAAAIALATNSFGFSQNISWTQGQDSTVVPEIARDTMGPPMPAPEMSAAGHTKAASFGGPAMSEFDILALEYALVREMEFWSEFYRPVPEEMHGLPELENEAPLVAQNVAVDDAETSPTARVESADRLARKIMGTQEEVDVAVLEEEVPEPRVVVVSAPLLVPFPAPVALRPMMEVHPVSVANVDAARSVSGDPLVHDLAQGSWPRRLDQVNTRDFVDNYRTAQVNGGELFWSNWVEVRGGPVSVIVPK